jgi:hypothetical protein
VSTRVFAQCPRERRILRWLMPAPHGMQSMADGFRRYRRERSLRDHAVWPRQKCARFDVSALPRPPRRRGGNTLNTAKSPVPAWVSCADSVTSATRPNRGAANRNRRVGALASAEASRQGTSYCPRPQLPAAAIPPRSAARATRPQLPTRPRRGRGARAWPRGDGRRLAAEKPRPRERPMLL